MVVVVGVVLAACSTTTAGPSVGADAAGWGVRIDPPDRASRVVPLLVEERECASGMRADGRIQAAVEELAREVRITVSVRRLAGGQDCQGNPLTPVTVTLSEPLGDRRLIDGATGAPPSLNGFGTGWLEPVELRPSPEAVTLVVPVSERTVSDEFFVEPRCELDGSLEESYLPEWLPIGEFVDAALVLSAAVVEVGLSVDGWHGYRAFDSIGRHGWTWAQYLQGRPVAAVTAFPGVLGWRGMAVGCGDLPAGWVPDPAPPTNAQPAGPSFAPRLDVGSILSEVEELTRVGSGWVFDHPDHRCEAWIEMEDRIEDAGYFVAQVVERGAWPNDKTPGPTVVRQVSALITDADGRATVITTTGANTLATSEATITGAVETPSPSSYLFPCHLDRPLGVDLLH